MDYCDQDCYYEQDGDNTENWSDEEYEACYTVCMAFLELLE